MSPGNRPSHFGAKPLHMINPTNVVITPTITMNFPSSRTVQKVARIEPTFKERRSRDGRREVIQRVARIA
jgi:hypothetical protein